MKINKYQDVTALEDKIDIYYREMSSDIFDLLNYLQSKQERRIIGNHEGVQKILKPHEIYYFESVDKKCFCYMEKSVYQVDLNLQELETLLCMDGFFRSNKSMIVNILKIAYIKAEKNMRVNAYLENDEVIVINRHYKKNFQECLVGLKANGGRSV